jgi:DNA uptake protein ComE-like DNA-binding protein
MGFLILAVTLRRRVWVISSVAYFVAGTTIFVAFGSVDTGTKEEPVTTPLSTTLTVLLLLFWLGGMVHSVLSNRQWLRGLAFRSPRAWYAEGLPQQAASSDANQQHPLDQALRSSPASTGTGVDVADRASTPTVTQPDPATLNLNSATARDIQRVLGFTPEWSEHIIAARAFLGGFDSADQLLTVAKVPPHVYLGVKNRITTTASSRPAVPSSRRRLDL